jgi:hypothetical protein
MRKSREALIRCDGLPGIGAAVLIAITGCVLAACSDSAAPAFGSSAGAPAAATMQVLTDSSGTQEAETKTSYALEVLTQQCMQEKGLIYYVTPPADNTPATGETTLPEFPVYTSLAQRQTNGYGDFAKFEQQALSGQNPTIQHPDQEDQYLRSLSGTAQQNYTATELGPPGDTISFTLPGGLQGTIAAGGCRAAGAKKIYGSVANYVQATEGRPLLTDILLHNVESSAAFTAVVRNWSACMAASDFSYASPSVAYDAIGTDYAQVGPTQAMRQREIAVAVSDLECARKVSLFQTVTRLQDQDAARLGRTLEGDLLRITQIDTVAAKRAAALVPGG